MTTNELHVLHSKELSLVEAFCLSGKPYDNDQDESFIRAIKESCQWHMKNNEFYKNLCEQEKFSVSMVKTKDDLYKIPTVMAHFFKEYEELSVKRDEVALHLTSSGTTGQKSQVFFDEWSIKAPQRMLDLIFEHYQWITPDAPANYLLYTYETESDSKLGTAYTDHYLCKYAPALDIEIALKLQGDGTHSFDFSGVLSALKKFEASERPVRIFGFPAFLNETLNRMEKLGMTLKLHPESLVFLGGGWKGKASEAISKTALYSKVTQILGIPDERLRDGFGSVEHCIPYVECSKHEFHVPVWSEVIIRDVKTLRPTEEMGFLSFVSPYMTSMPAHSVTMGDLASLHQNCECGNPRPFFRLHGRAGTTQNKSCAIAAAEILGRS
jgi:phenylacetate-coenzyme A ligase PaaK-like adenylate-forming protein